jgi:hypothetical protein
MQTNLAQLARAYLVFANDGAIPSLKLINGIATNKRRHTWRQNFAFSALFMYLYRVKQYNQILKTEVYHEYLILLSQDCEVILVVSVCCAYEDSIASRYYDDESDQRDITCINST